YNDYRIPIKEIEIHDEMYQQACQKVVLKFCLEDTTFAKDILSEQDYEKCLTLIERKQYNSKLLKDLLIKFYYFLAIRVPEEDKSLENLLKLDIIRQTNELREKSIEQTFLPLKKQIEEIASGVKGICYLTADNPQKYRMYRHIDQGFNADLNKYIKEQFSYDFNKVHCMGNMNLLVLFTNREEQLKKIMQLALFNDSKFWEDHSNFNVISFIELVCKNNDLRHAEKVLDYIFNEIQKQEVGKKIIANSLPLNFLNHKEFIARLEERTFKFTFDRFGDEYNLESVSNASLCYPFAQVDNIEDKIRQGKKTADELFREVYPEDYVKITNLLKEEISNPSLAITDKGFHKVLDSRTEIKDIKWTIKSIFDYPTFGYHTDISDREAVKVYCPEYFSANNIWNRFYLKCFYMTGIVKDKKLVFANLFEIYYDLFQFIEKKTGIRTVYQRNIEGRDNAFAQLKTILKSYDVDISEDFKDDYIIALLDRKVAIREESERFPILEQLGDAVYGLAVAELLFYNPNETDMAKSYNDFICAQAQINVAKKIGVDRLYLSSHSLPRKYESDILIDADRESYTIRLESEQFSNKQKYIADSLEMIIGVICKDCGFEKALTFSKSILRKTYSKKLNTELHWGDNHDGDIDTDYWQRILPSPYSHFDNYQHTLWQAFDKFYKAIVLGTEEKEIRNYIAYSLGDKGLYDSNSFYEVNRVFYEYLHHGLKNAISKYGDSVKTKFNQIKK
ncbi:MAG: hypothetical protein K2I80_02980, partial [Ruminococcus sp.]|nr:hypothetical protein [Ruminococcus sp.]